MIRIDLFLFGYFKFKIDVSDIPRASTAFLRANLSAKIDCDGAFFVPLLRKKKYIEALGSIKYEMSELAGVLGFLQKNRKRYGAILAIALLAIYYAFTSAFVWDIRIEGNEKLSAAAVEEELYQAGLSVGMAWRRVSYDKVEGYLLTQSKDIGWVNINRRGNVAYVTVKEKTLAQSDDAGAGYSNIVAQADCVIEEITVKSGIAMVKAGDTVKAGQLLISGVIPKEYGGGFVDAEGEIYGRVTDEISVEVLRSEPCVEYKNEVLDEAYLNIFNFSIKIFKNYRNVDNDYVIIEDKERCVVFEKRLPIGLTRIYKQARVEYTEERTDKELTSIARARLSKLRIMAFSDAEILKMSTYGEFTDNGYSMTSSVSLLRQIGEKKYF